MFSLKNAIALLGAKLIDLSGHRAVLLADQTSGVLFSPEGYRLITPVNLDADVELDGPTEAGFLMAAALQKLIATSQSNPTIYDALIDAGLELGMEFEPLDAMCREFCGLPSREPGELMGFWNPEDEIEAELGQAPTHD